MAADGGRGAGRTPQDGHRATYRGRRHASDYVAKARVEIRALEDAGVVLQGNAFSSVLLAKGTPGPAERASGGLLAGPDGKALRAALLKLGYAPEDWAAVATWRGQGDGAAGDATAGGGVADGMAGDGGAAGDVAKGSEVLDASTFRLVVATLDPATIIVCDEDAAAVVRNAFSEELYGQSELENALLVPGRVVDVAGMRVLNLGGFEAALADAHEKQVMWAWLKQLPPLGEPY